LTWVLNFSCQQMPISKQLPVSKVPISFLLVKEYILTLRFDFNFFNQKEYRNVRTQK